MRKLVLPLISIALVVTVGPTPSAQNIADAYEKALYPNGIPIRLDWEGKSHVPTFALMDDAATAGNIRAALVSERVPTGSYDEDFVIRFATFLGSPGPLKVAQVVDLTTFLTNYVDAPGNFYAAGGSVTPFSIDAKRSGLHVNAYSEISGSGAILHAFDLFFELRDTGTLIQVLLLPRTTERGRLNAGNYKAEDSSIFLVDANGDGIQEIVVQRRRDEIVDGRRVRPPVFPLQVYAFDGSEYRPSTATRVVLANRQPLERAASVEVGTAPR
jgi:hypothetical protein